MPQVTVGLVGAGFVARLHVSAWRRVAGVEVSVAAVAAGHRQRAEGFAHRHGIPTVHASVEDLLADPVITVIDLCVPNHLHHGLAMAALAAGKHVVVEKPLTGCFASGPAAGMLERAVGAADEVVSAADRAGRLACYAENWVYAPAVRKAERLLSAAGGTILRMHGEESHSGTHAELNKHWVTAGGGSLLGKGCHPLGAALWLKAKEGLRRNGRPVRPATVVAETASLTTVPSFTSEDPKWLRTGYDDVEDWGSLLLTFDDGTVAEITASDIVLGGVRNRLSVFGSNAVVEANLNPNTALQAYAPDPVVFGDEYLSEKLETKAGWSWPSPDEDWMQGYPQEIQDFAECIHHHRSPEAGASLGRDVVAVIYAAYQSATEGKRIELHRWFR